MADDDVRTIWMIGDPWRDLRDEVLVAGAATVVTEQSVYHLYIAEGLAVRVPGPHATRMSSGVRPLHTVDVLTPCGLVLNRGLAGWAMSTRLALVVDGCHDLHTSGLADELIAVVEAGGVSFDTRHAGPECGALWCPT